MSFDKFDTDAVATAGITFSNANLTATGGGTSLGASGIAQTLEGKKSGKWYLEFTCVAVSGNTDGVGIVASNGVEGNGFLGNDYHSTSWGFFTNSHVVNGTTSQTAVNATTFGAVDVIGMAIDLDNSKIWWRKNTGSWIGASGTPNPATNTGGFSLATAQTNNKRVFPAINNSGSAASFTMNSGASTFMGAVPSGFNSGWTNTNAGNFFGSLAYTAAGGVSNIEISQGQKAVSPYVSPVNNILTSITVNCYIGASLANMNACVYADSAGVPGALLATSTATGGAGTGTGEFVFTFASIPLSAGTKYWFGVNNSSSSGTPPGMWCPASTNGIYYNTGPFPTPSDPFGSASAYNYRYPMLMGMIPVLPKGFVQVCG